MPLLEAPIECDVCHEHTQWGYSNEVFLGRPDMICWFCFMAWFEGGLVNEGQIRRDSLRQRYAEMS